MIQPEVTEVDCKDFRDREFIKWDARGRGEGRSSSLLNSWGGSIRSDERPIIGRAPLKPIPLPFVP